MSRYIDAEPYSGCRIVANREDGGIAIDEVKTVDVIPVVRCRECFFSRKVDDKEPMYKCVNICRDGCTQWLDSNDFCSYGERRSE